MRKASANRTIVLSDEEKKGFRTLLLKLQKSASTEEVLGKIINQDIFEVVSLLPSEFVDLLFIDPPYNLDKKFNNHSFKRMATDEYVKWLDSWLSKTIRLLKPTASIYICSDWFSSSAVHLVCEKYFKVRNRITFEREKGRGSSKNWKNNSEDIWFCTMSDKYTFNPDAVKLKKKVIAPYREGGKPKDWVEENGEKFRLTYSSNVWTDITIPFWSMPENTPHPTQKPEKLLAKIILASSNEGDVVFDPFAGVGTSGVVAKKLGRNFVMVEIEEEYCLYALKRLQMAETDKTIQGYYDGVFYERNTLIERLARRPPKRHSKTALFTKNGDTKIEKLALLQQ
ncbi:MAG: DNA methyltransferase [Planctomycetota bacterium]|nr:DNA methyltransferase [Planctomycetota bacterium]